MEYIWKVWYYKNGMDEKTIYLKAKTADEALKKARLIDEKFNMCLIMEDV